MRSVRLLKILIILLALALGGAAHFDLLNKHCRGFYFLGFSTYNILFNNEALIPPFQEDINTYSLISLNTLLPNTLESDHMKKNYQLDSIKPHDYIVFFVGLKAYKINFFDKKNMPSYHISTTPDVTPGYYFLTPFKGKNCSKSYAYIVDEKGSLRYYRRNQQNNRCISDFKKTVTTDHKIRFTFMEQEKPVPPTLYLSGHLLVLDEKFQPLKKLYLKPYGTHGKLQTENHESLYFNDHHYILSGYWETEIYDPETDNPIFVAAPVVQEIKNNKVVFEFNGADHPEFLKTSIFKRPKSGYWDYLHYNSIAIDPTDGNWILSFAAQSSLVKIDKKRRKVSWIMSGKANMFDFEKPENYFSFQHKPVFLNKNTLLLFDNNFYRNDFEPKVDKPYSRLCSFTFDEKNYKISNYREIPVNLSASMGNVSRTENGTYVYSGGSNSFNSCVEITPDNKILYQLSLSDTSTYRCYKYKSVF